MTEDVGSTPRKPLTGKQALALWESQKGICPLCAQKMQVGEPRIDEHLRALGLGGTNAFDNRAFVHKACASTKTYGPDGDLARIAKAKRVKSKHLGLATKPKSSLRGESRADKEARRAEKTAGRLSQPRNPGLYGPK